MSTRDRMNNNVINFKNAKIDRKANDRASKYIHKNGKNYLQTIDTKSKG